MTLYKESMRRLFRVGLVLMLLSVVASLTWTFLRNPGQGGTKLPSALEMAPVLAVYAFVGGIGMAFSGFSFLNRRSESDFYHSIPARRADLYFSIVAAAVTWLFATVVLSSLASTIAFLLMKTPFVPLYPLMNVGFFFAAALLVFAAAAIGCALTGTWFSNIVVTGLVLLLPRYIFYIVVYGAVVDTSIVSWLDFKLLLDPSTNAATSLITFLSHRELGAHIVSLPGILWSLFVALAELAAGALLFVRRPSELAENGAKNRALQTVFACLVALPLLLMVAVLGLRWVTPIFIIIVLAASLACYAIYQLIVLRNFRRMLRSLPWYLCTVVVAAAVLFAGEATTWRVQRDIPAASDIAYVRFLGYDRNSSQQSYASLSISGIKFSEDVVVDLVAKTLRANVEDHQRYGYVIVDSEYYVNTESVQIVLHNGRKINRQLIFPDSRMLEEYLSENEAYRHAIRQLPPEQSVRIVTSGISYADNLGENPNANTPALFALYQQYANEQSAGKTIIPYWKFDPAKYENYYGNYDGHTYSQSEEKQQFGEVMVSGYVGTKRYSDNISITLATPKAASRMMALKNRYANDVDGSEFAAAHKKAKELDALSEYYYYYLYLQVYNYPGQGGERYTALYSWYSNNTPDSSIWQRYTGFAPLLDEIAEILLRGELTDDPTALCVVPTYDFQQGDSVYNSTWSVRFLSFSPADEKRLLEILSCWDSLEAAQKELLQQMIDEELSVPLPGPTPTPPPTTGG